jgi:molecular chaperone GrpE
MERDDWTRPPTTDGPAAEAAGLEAELAAAKEEAKQAQDRWLRERADLENYKKRSAREREDAVRFGTEKLVRDLLPVVDNLERAVTAASERGSDPSLTEGVALVRKTVLDALERHGVSRVAAAGERFDPSHHEAVAHIESEEHEPNAVIAEHQPGYRLHDRLLRPAMVTVSKGSSAPGNLAKDRSGD